jgi:hypothetical protein
MSRNTRRAAAVLVATAAFAGAGVAHAGITGSLTAGQTVTAASWGVTPTGDAGTGPPSLTWDSIGSLVGAYRYFRAYNTGTVALTGTTWSFAVNKVNNNGNNVPPTKVEACVGGVFEPTLGTCSTGAANIVTIAQTSTTKFAVTADTNVVPAAPGSFLSMRVSPQTSNFGQPFFATVSTTVSAATQIRPDQVTNS